MNAIVTENVVIPFEKIEYMERSGKDYFVMYGSGGTTVPNKQGQEYIKWLVIKYKQEENLTKQTTSIVGSNEIDCNKTQEQPILTIDFIKHMVDNYEVKCTVQRTGNFIELEISNTIITRFRYLKLTNDYEIKDIEKAKRIMNNEDDYFNKKGGQ